MSVAVSRVMPLAPLNRAKSRAVFISSVPTPLPRAAGVVNKSPSNQVRCASMEENVGNICTKPSASPLLSMARKITDSSRAIRSAMKSRDCGRLEG
ncbi:hypothetical protein D3C84_1002910 [compost metagenome]